MLNYKVIGPLHDGSYCVAYQTPGCLNMTTVCPCRTRQQAERALDEFYRDGEARQGEPLCDTKVPALPAYQLQRGA